MERNSRPGTSLRWPAARSPGRCNSARHCKLVIRNLNSIATPTTRSTARTARGGRPLQAGEYFVLGDNSGNSQDSRKWPRPGVPEADFVGKPFLIHQPLRTARSRSAGGSGIFQTVDWSRLRWLH